MIIAAGLVALVWGDLALRSREAYKEGEKHMRWHADQGLQRAAWDAWLRGEEGRLEALAAKGLITAHERRLRVELARSEHHERVAESPLKGAVRWFETAARFSPPPSPWSIRAKAREASARALWERELQAAGLDPAQYAY